MDDSQRELGTGDVVVGKKVRRAAAGFYERVRDYRGALAGSDGRTLEEALTRHGLAAGSPQTTTALAAYVRGAAAALAGQGGDEVLEGRLAFPAVPVPAEGSR
jgi:cytochrome b pre-mRNA-processing protein 3